MANENETVGQVCGAMIIEADECDSSNEVIEGYELREFADRVLAAHKRELTANDAKIDRSNREYIRCREELHATRERRDDCEVKMHKALERVTRAEKALAAKDEEIARLEQELFENKTQYGSLLIGRDALIKEMCEMISSFRDESCSYCCTHGHVCDDNDGVCHIDEHASKLIEKAREVLGVFAEKQDKGVGK